MFRNVSEYKFKKKKSLIGIFVFNSILFYKLDIFVIIFKIWEK